MSSRAQIPMKPTAAPARSFTPAPFGTLQRKCACGGSGSSGGDCEGCQKKKLQRSGAGRGPDTAPPIVHDVLRSPGKPLDAQTRAYFEPRFGHDFSKVRLHTDSEAAESARSVNALAYTVGPQIVFGAGLYQPAAASGQRLLAHELTHVVQQKDHQPAGRALGVGLGSDSAEREAEHAASAVADQRAFPSVGCVSGFVQRQEAAPPGASPSGGGATAAPSPPLPSTKDCTPDQITQIETELAEARSWLNDAEPKISAFSAGKASPADAAVVKTALDANFHATSPTDIATIAGNFASLRTALNSSITIACASSFWCEPRERAYVRGAFAWIRRLRNVNVCPLHFSCKNSLIRVGDFIHERAHQYPGATDNAYEWDAKYKTQPTADAIDNADSYAVATRQIHEGGTHGPGESC